MSSRPNNQHNDTNFSFDEEGVITLDELIKIIFKNKKLIAFISLFGVTISTLFALSRQNIFAGQFQILVREENSPMRSNSSNLENSQNSLISSLSGGLTNKLSTEIEILKSPSVLSPVFDFVKEQKRLQGINVEKMKFSDWLKNNMVVDLVKGTNVLDLTYKDNNKDIIMPTLEVISKTYQDYSGRNRTEGLDKGLKYLSEQIAKYQKLSSSSLQKSSLHAKENDLIPIPPSALSNSQNYKDISQNNVEVLRINASNEVKTLERQLYELEKNPINKKSDPYLFINKLEDKSILKRINAIESEIINLETYFKGNDPDLERLNNEKTNLELLLKEKVSNALSGQLKLAKAKLLSFERPINVLTKHDELIRETILNFRTLSRLKNDQIQLELEKARNEDPWEIITNPTIFNDPIAPNKKSIVLIGTMLSILFSITIITLVIKWKGIIYSRDEIERILGISVLQEFSLKNFKNIEENFELLSNNVNLINEKSSLALLSLGTIKSDVIDKLRTFLNSNQSFKEVLVTKNYLEAKNFDKQFLFIKKGEITKKDLFDLKQKLLINGEFNLSLFLLDD